MGIFAPQNMQILVMGDPQMAFGSIWSKKLFFLQILAFPHGYTNKFTCGQLKLRLGPCQPFDTCDMVPYQPFKLVT